MKGGQGLSINTIVIIAIAVLILLLVVAFTTGSLGKLFGSERVLEREVTPDELAAFKLGCQQACFSAQQLSKTDADWKASDYCKKNIINGTQALYCRDVGISCSASVIIKRTEVSRMVDEGDC